MVVRVAGTVPFLAELLAPENVTTASCPSGFQDIGSDMLKDRLKAYDIDWCHFKMVSLYYRTFFTWGFGTPNSAHPCAAWIDTRVGHGLK